MWTWDRLILIYLFLLSHQRRPAAPSPRLPPSQSQKQALQCVGGGFHPREVILNHLMDMDHDAPPETEKEEEAPWHTQVKHVPPRIDDRYQCEVPDWDEDEVNALELATKASLHTLTVVASSSLALMSSQPAVDEPDQSFPVWSANYDTVRQRQRANVPGRAGERLLHAGFILPPPSDDSDGPFCSCCLLTTKVPPSRCFLPLETCTAVSDYLVFSRTLTEQTPFQWKQVCVCTFQFKSGKEILSLRPLFLRPFFSRGHAPTTLAWSRWKVTSRRSRTSARTEGIYPARSTVLWHLLGPAEVREPARTRLVLCTFFSHTRSRWQYLLSGAERSRRHRDEKAFAAAGSAPMTNTLDYRDQPAVKDIYGFLEPDAGKCRRVPRCTTVQLPVHSKSHAPFFPPEPYTYPEDLVRITKQETPLLPASASLEKKKTEGSLSTRASSSRDSTAASAPKESERCLHVAFIVPKFPPCSFFATHLTPTHRRVHPAPELVEVEGQTGRA
jgi:hypothetical protein